MGEIDEAQSDVVQLRGQLGQLCKDSVILVLILGKNALIKKSASAGLFRKLDNFQFEYGLVMRSEPALEPMEVLTHN